MSDPKDDRENKLPPVFDPELGEIDPENPDETDELIDDYEAGQEPPKNNT